MNRAKDAAVWLLCIPFALAAALVVVVLSALGMLDDGDQADDADTCMWAELDGRR